MVEADLQAGHAHARAHDADGRDAAVRRARWLNGATIGWNGLEGVIAVAAGLAPAR